MGEVGRVEGLSRCRLSLFVSPLKRLPHWTRWRGVSTCLGQRQFAELWLSSQLEGPLQRAQARGIGAGRPASSGLAACLAASSSM